MITPRQQNIVIGNLSFENEEKVKCLGETVTNTNDIREEIKDRMHVIIQLRKYYRPACFPRK